jgi:predicted nucleotide-binding protein
VHATSIAERIERGDVAASMADEEGADEIDRLSRRVLQCVRVFGAVLDRYSETVCGRVVETTRRPGSNLPRELRREIRVLEGVAERLEAPSTGHDASPRTFEGDCVLVVYGRNDAAREKVARFLAKLGLEPILLDEEVAEGRTLIEKLDGQIRPEFAVVLVTGDDVGALASASSALRPRARQNVILELGFCLGRFGRARVSALYEDGVELPSDFCGVEYTAFDANGGWKLKLARELHHAGLRFDPLRAL